MRIGRSTNSKSLIATANDHLADVYASLAAVIGIGLAFVGKAMTFTGLPTAMLRRGYRLLLGFEISCGDGARNPLMFSWKKPSINTCLPIYALIEAVPQVKRIDRVRAREHGHYILVDARISVPGDLTIQQGHDISRAIKKSIMEQHSDVDEVLIHLNPWYKESDLNVCHFDYK